MHRPVIVGQGALFPKTSKIINERLLLLLTSLFLSASAKARVERENPDIMNASNSSALKGNLKSLVATGGVLASAGISSQSQAAIIYTDITPLSISAGQNIYFSLTGQDADTTIGGVEGGPQLRLYFQSNVSSSPNLAALDFDNDLAAIQGFNAGTYNAFFASRLTGGSVINGAANFSSYGYALLTYPEGAGYAAWAPITAATSGAHS